MAHEGRLRGYAAELARDLTRSKKPGAVVSTINARLSPGLRRTLFDGLPEQLRVERGLSLDPHSGKLAVAQAVEISRPTSAGAKASTELPLTQMPTTAAELAGVVSKTRVVPAPKVHPSSTLFVVDYGARHAIAPRSVPAALSTSTTYGARLDVMRRAPSVTEAEVSFMAHDGSHATDGNGFGSVPAHAANIFAELTKSPNSVTWHTRPQTGNVTYGAFLAPLADGYVPTIVRSEFVGEAIEIGAAFGYAGLECRAASRGRIFGLTAETFFTADPELIEQAVDGELQPDEKFDLNGDAATFAASFVDDPEALVPSYTSFTMTQQVIGRPQTATYNDFPIA